MLSLLSEAAMDTRAPVAHRMSAAIAWAEAARSAHHESTMLAYRLALQLLDTTVVLARSVEGGRSKLAMDEVFEWRNLATDAASYAIDSRDVVLALELLELGRNILFRHLGWYRTPLDTLLASKDAHTHRLAQRFQELSSSLRRSVVSDTTEDVGPEDGRSDDKVARQVTSSSREAS